MYAFRWNVPFPFDLKYLNRFANVFFICFGRTTRRNKILCVAGNSNYWSITCETLWKLLLCLIISEFLQKNGRYTTLKYKFTSLLPLPCSLIFLHFFSKSMFSPELLVQLLPIKRYFKNLFCNHQRE